MELNVRIYRHIHSSPAISIHNHIDHDSRISFEYLNVQRHKLIRQRTNILSSKWVRARAQESEGKITTFVFFVHIIWLCVAMYCAPPKHNGVNPLRWKTKQPPNFRSVARFELKAALLFWIIFHQIRSRSRKNENCYICSLTIIPIQQLTMMLMIIYKYTSVKFERLVFLF